MTAAVGAPAIVGGVATTAALSSIAARGTVVSALSGDWKGEQDPALALARAARSSVEALENALALARAVPVGGNQASLRDEALVVADKIAQTTASTLDALIAQISTPEPRSEIVKQTGQTLDFVTWFLQGAVQGLGGEAVRYLCDHEWQIAQHLRALLAHIAPLAHMILRLVQVRVPVCPDRAGPRRTGPRRTRCKTAAPARGDPGRTPKPPMLTRADPQGGRVGTWLRSPLGVR
jgi:hypothetical protein